MPPDPQTLARALQQFLCTARAAVVMEDGHEVFDLARSRYSVTCEHNKCLLHLWSAERNIVRRVLQIEQKHGVLRTSVQRFGQNKPSHLEILLDRDTRAPAARRAARLNYEHLLQRVLEREFPGFVTDKLSTTTDLERSLSPVYARGIMHRGHSAFAVLGVNAQEQQGSIDAALTFGLIWLDHCRRQYADRLIVEGLRLFLPAGTTDVVRERMAWLNMAGAKLELYALSERDRIVEQLDTCDCGNIATRLVHCPDETAARERFAAEITRVLACANSSADRITFAVLSPAEIAFRVHGLEFARARLAENGISFRTAHEVVFGIGGSETLLDQSSEPQFRELLSRILRARHSDGDHNDLLWRMHPERWLESLVIANVHALDARLFGGAPPAVYSQVPAFAASDRGMIDVLTCTSTGRLAVIELKADEDIHLPLQGLDYWARVHWHHSRGEFQRFGYFPGATLSSEPPLLLLVAPALHVHPATDTLLRYMSPAIGCDLVGIDERWRDGVRVVFRKHHSAHVGTYAAVT